MKGKKSSMQQNSDVKAHSKSEQLVWLYSLCFRQYLIKHPIIIPCRSSRVVSISNTEHETEAFVCFKSKKKALEPSSCSLPVVSPCPCPRSALRSDWLVSSGSGVGGANMAAVLLTPEILRSPLDAWFYSPVSSPLKKWFGVRIPRLSASLPLCPWARHVTRLCSDNE